MKVTAARPRFLCDGMLGDVARWLRLLGFDAEYAGSTATDEEVLERLRREDRMLATRDVDLHGRAERSGRASVLVPVPPIEDEVVAVLRATDADPRRDLWFTRCTLCNAELVAATAVDVASVVPPRVRDEHSAFSSCPRCGHVYWEGTHVEQIRRQMDAVLKRLGA